MTVAACDDSGAIVASLDITLGSFEADSGMAEPSIWITLSCVPGRRLCGILERWQACFRRPNGSISTLVR